MHRIVGCSETVRVCECGSVPVGERVVRRPCSFSTCKARVARVGEGRDGSDGAPQQDGGWLTPCGSLPLVLLRLTRIAIVGGGRQFQGQLTSQTRTPNCTGIGQSTACHPPANNQLPTACNPQTATRKLITPVDSRAPDGQTKQNG